MSCDRVQENLNFCTCTYAGCSRMGQCCECVRYHQRMRQLPGCFFPKDEEATYDRSYEHFARLVLGR